MSALSKRLFKYGVYLAVVLGGVLLALVGVHDRSLARTEHAEGMGTIGLVPTAYADVPHEKNSGGDDDDDDDDDDGS